MWDPYGDFEKVVLPNGLTIYALHVDRSFQEFGAVIHSGAREDPEGKDGLAHFTEHCVSSNASDFTFGEIENFFEVMGAACMLGSTNYHHTNYAFSCELQKASFSKALKIFGKMLIDSKLTARIEEQREIITQEFYRDFPSDNFFELQLLCHNNSYPQHRLENYVCPLGTKSSIRSISQTDLQSFHDQHYTPQNMSIVTLGGLLVTEVVSLIENSPFGANKVGRRNPLLIASHITPVPTCNRFDTSMKFILGKDHKNNYGIFAAYSSCPGTLQGEAVNIANKILYKQLNREIREKRQWCYSLNVSSQYLQDIHKVSFEMNIPPEKLSEIETVIEDCLTSIFNDRKLFETVRNYQIRKLDFLDPTLKKILEHSTEDLINFNRIISIQEARAKRLSITFQDVQDVFSCLRSSNRLTILIYP